MNPKRLYLVLKATADYITRQAQWGHVGALGHSQNVPFQVCAQKACREAQAMLLQLDFVIEEWEKFEPFAGMVEPSDEEYSRLPQCSRDYMCNMQLALGEFSLEDIAEQPATPDEIARARAEFEQLSDELKKSLKRFERWSNLSGEEILHDLMERKDDGPYTQR